VTVLPASGSGPGTVTVSWAENTWSSPRSGSATVAGHGFAVTQAGHAAPVFTDSLTAGTTPIKAQHVAGLRQAIDTLRARYGLAVAAWTDATLAAGSSIKAIHLTELRTFLAAVSVAAGQATPGYVDPTIAPGVTVVRAAHIVEIRAAVLSLW
jgi:hypothetical protein